MALRLLEAAKQAGQGAQRAVRRAPGDGHAGHHDVPAGEGSEQSVEDLGAKLVLEDHADLGEEHQGDRQRQVAAREGGELRRRQAFELPARLLPAPEYGKRLGENTAPGGDAGLLLGQRAQARLQLDEAPLLTAQHVGLGSQQLGIHRFFRPARQRGRLFDEPLGLVEAPGKERLHSLVLRQHKWCEPGTTAPVAPGAPPRRPPRLDRRGSARHGCARSERWRNMAALVAGQLGEPADLVAGLEQLPGVRPAKQQVSPNPSHPSPHSSIADPWASSRASATIASARSS